MSVSIDLSLTVGETAYKALRNDIVSGKLAPGTRIKLEHAKEHYAASVSTLREVLNRLAAEGLILAEGQRGFEVKPVSQQELLELGDLRLLLEGHAMALSFAAGDLDWEARVVAAHHKLSAIERQLLRGDGTRISDWVRYDWEFHQALVSACQSTTLIATLSSVFDRFLRYHLLAESFRGKPVVDDHRLLFELAMKRDAAGAQEMLARHVRNGTEHVIQSGRIR